MLSNNLQRIARVHFPLPRGININMMPFIMGNPKSIPPEYRHYQRLIDRCGLHQSQLGKVGFLSISESQVEKNQTQRRPGLHTEKHPGRPWGGWGGQYRTGGLYMATTVDKSCRLWDTHVEQTGHMGDCEHLRNTLPTDKMIEMEKDRLYWLTDSVPHEAMPAQEDGYRQWFRLVTSDVGLWYAAHSTQNRLGVVPKCRIIEGNKFV